MYIYIHRYKYVCLCVYLFDIFTCLSTVCVCLYTSACVRTHVCVCGFTLDKLLKSNLLKSFIFSLPYYYKFCSIIEFLIFYQIRDNKVTA